MRYVIRLVGGRHCGAQIVVKRGSKDGPPTHVSYESTMYVISRYLSSDTLLYDYEALDFTTLYKD